MPSWFRSWIFKLPPPRFMAPPIAPPMAPPIILLAMFITPRAPPTRSWTRLPADELAPPLSWSRALSGGRWKRMRSFSRSCRNTYTGSTIKTYLQTNKIFNNRLGVHEINYGIIGTGSLFKHSCIPIRLITKIAKDAKFATFSPNFCWYSVLIKGHSKIHANVQPTYFSGAPGQAASTRGTKALLVQVVSLDTDVFPSCNPRNTQSEVN